MSDEVVVNQSIIHDEPKPQEKESGLPGCPFWMVTFGDVVSLLMTFFVLILSFTELSPNVTGKIEYHSGKGGGDEFRAVSGIGGDGAINANSNASSGSEKDNKFLYMEKQVNSEALNLEADNQSKVKYSMEEVSNYLSQESNAVAKDAIHVKKSQSSGGFKLSIDQKFAFSLGTARFHPENKVHLDRIAKFASELPNDIILSCSSNDFNRIAYPLYPSNAHLSIARCNALAEFLITAWHVVPERIGIKIVQQPESKSTTGVSSGSVEAELSIEINSDFTGFIRSELKAYDTNK
jgi:chemotaxis protein MotB